LLTILRTNFDESDVMTLLNRIREWKRSRGDRSKDSRRVGTIERFIHYVAKNVRPDFHWPDFIDDDKLPCLHGYTDRFSADAFQPVQIEPVFSDALLCVEIYMRKHSLFTAQSDNLESDTLAEMANFLRVKTARWQREFAHHSLD